MREHTTIRAGGAALIAGAVAFLGVFAFLAARFDYPAILDGTAAEVLPKLLATGATGRAVWAVYGFLPIIWIPAGVAAFHALRGAREGSARAGMLFAVVAALSMMLGLLRWPSIHWHLAEAYAGAAAPERTALAAVFAGLNSYLGNYRRTAISARTRTATASSTARSPMRSRSAAGTATARSRDYAESAHLRPGRAAARPRPRADPQRGRPPPLRMGRARRAGAC